MTTDASLQTLLDREAIRECVFAYCRGIDRCDEDALRGSYWPDATDSHGIWKGSAASFIDSALAQLRQGPRMIHSVGNLSITLRGHQAAVETYFMAWQTDPPSKPNPQQSFLAGRYLDRFEKRGGEWRVAARVVVFDWLQPLGPVPAGNEAERFGPRTPIGARQPDDPWYALLASLG